MGVCLKLFSGKTIRTEEMGQVYSYELTSKTKEWHHEVEKYFVEINSNEKESAKFFDYYTANGWKVGRSSMKNWQAAARNWIRNAKNESQSQLNFTQNAKDRRDIVRFKATGSDYD